MAKTVLPEKLKICFVAYKFPILGRSTDHGFLWPIAKGLASLGHEVSIIAGSGNLGKSEVVRDGVKAYYLTESEALNPRRFPDLAYQKFAELHKLDAFHIVHSLDSSAMKIARKKHKLNVAVAYDADATQMSQLFAILGMTQETVESLLFTGLALIYKFVTTYLRTDRRLLNHADGIFVSTPQQRTTLERYYLYPDFHIYTVPYGIELGDLSPREQEISLKKRIGIPESSQVIVTVSDMIDTDALIHLLRAFEKLAIKKPSAHMIIVGNGPKWKDIEYHMLQLALGKRVHMVGAIKEEDLGDYITLSDVFVNLSAKTTGFDPVLIEAMAQQKVVIGSEVSALANVIEDSVDGFLLRPADTKSLSELLLDLFSENIDTKQIGQKARSKVLGQFNTGAMISATQRAYQQILVASGQFKWPKVSKSPKSPPDATNNALQP